jgi:hypothetical protein
MVITSYFNGIILSIKWSSGWWYTYLSETYEFVSWDDDILNIWKRKPVPNHQPELKSLITGISVP